MSKLRKLPYGVPEITRDLAPQPSPIVIFLVMALTAAAGLGEWKVLNNALGGLPKIVSLGVIALAFLYFLVKADFDNMRRALSYLPVFLLYIGVLLLWSLAIWMLDLTSLSSIIRGSSKLLYQLFTILFSVSFVYICGKRAVDCFFYSIVAANAAIALLEIPTYGLGASLQSVIHCILTFGDAAGYVRALEIHDLTFLFGQFLVYYIALAPRDTKAERRAAWIKSGISLFFMLLGLKRTAIPAALLLAFYAWFVSRRKHIYRWILATAVAMIAFFWLYLYLIRSGLFTQLMHALGVNMMGRDYIWSMANPYYSLSPAFTGHGFEAVDRIVYSWYQSGLLNHSYPFHNDILKVYVELGFGGFCLWLAVLYLYYPYYWKRFHGEKVALVYFSLLAYMSITYLTDNTAFYYWSCIGLRLIPMAVSYSAARKHTHRWVPPSPEDITDAVWLLEMEGKHD